MNYKKARRLYRIVTMTGFALLFALLLFKEALAPIAIMIIFCTISLAIIVTDVVIILTYYRCPHCERMLPIRSWTVPDFCPRCGQKLDKKE